MGGLVILYTTVGGSIAVNKTHIQQMIIIMTGMITAFVVIISLLPPDISFKDAAFVAGKMRKLNTIDFSFDLNNRYTFWSGLIGGTFLMLSYFGTDQSQVQRYLGGSSIKQSRMGLLANGIVKIPMQFFILFTGAMVFVFFQFVTPPLFFNPVQENKVKSGEYSQQYKELEKQYNNLNKEKQQHIKEMLTSIDAGNGPKTNDAQEKVQNIHKKEIKVRESALLLIKEANPGADTNDTNYIFLNFVIHYLPIGLIGLVLASIISASMSSTSAELNALASTTVIDFYKRLIKKDASEAHYLKISKLATVFWGIYAIIFALFANRLGTLIEAVNILGSLVYGTILGIFLVAFYLKKVKGTPTFLAALAAEIGVLYCFLFTEIPFLWYNVIGCLLVIFLSLILNTLVVKQKR